MYKDIRERISIIPEDEFNIFKKGSRYGTTEWKYSELEDGRGTWDRKRRMIYTCAHAEDKQLIIKGTSDESLIYTNLGVTKELCEQIEKLELDYLENTEEIIPFSEEDMRDF